MNVATVSVDTKVARDVEYEHLPGSLGILSLGLGLVPNVHKLCLREHRIPGFPTLRRHVLEAVASWDLSLKVFPCLIDTDERGTNANSHLLCGRRERCNCF